MLASEAFEGRATGRVGERLAARYLADRFAAMGLAPASNSSEMEGGGFFQSFEFTAGVTLDRESTLTREEGAPLVLDRDWRPLAFSESGLFGPFAVLFAGYGFAAPAAEEIAAVDHYGDVDVSGAWVVVLRDWPDGAGEAERRHWGRYAGLRYKAILARERGAAGLIVIQRPMPRVGGEAHDPLIPLRFDGTAGSAAIPVLSLSEDRFDEMLEGSGHTTASLRERHDAGELLGAFRVPGVELRANVELAHEHREGVNVLARLGVGNPDAPALVVGAHYDHLGRAARRASLARSEERLAVHYGADDNASGVAAMLEIAREIRARVDSGELEPVRDVVFAAWSGEELGLLGSHAFVSAAARDGDTGNTDATPVESRDPHAAPAQHTLGDLFVANLNLDMVGRMGESLLIQGGASSTAWSDLVERAATRAPVSYQLQEESLLPTDASSFVTRGVPVLSGFTGAHGEYHTPRDTADLIDYAGLDAVTGLFSEIAALLISESEAPDFVAPTRRSGGPHGERSAGPIRLRAYLGTVPDYAAAVEGLALAAVVSEGPAERAGLRGGDVVTSLDGREIRNVYDYTFAIEALRPGTPVRVGIERNGSALEFELVPAARQ